MGIEGKPVSFNKCGTCGGGDADSSLCALARSGLQSQELQRASSSYVVGQNVYLEGDSSEGVYCLKKGLIAIRKTDVNGNSAVVRLVQPGEAFGHRSFLANEKHAGTAEVLMDAKLCFIPKSSLDHLLSQSPDVAVRFTRRVAKDLREIEELYLLTTTQPVRKRLAHLLLGLRTRYAQEDKAEDEIHLELPLSRQELAAAIGTRPETIARTIKKLEEDNLAIFKGRLVTIPCLENLLEDIESDV
ncbi:Crp/Fnr family transcriptional regulator [Terasakiella sp. A23]|uniref:Crp/Fnr family transcriptional regulator n=1 Tax=Terasakiella sp. FCG-A23 TaxID=3080561 RepID=UPI0029538477|nr:Crp/Fnr family transcriptional regulator [Terasakiella sp. A23]MDV7338746.1 Crp/Fnr family transcriptional regulator [Terasakiella sp. A23]